MKNIRTLLFITLFFNLNVSAQNANSAKHSGEFWLGFQTISPLGDFAKKSEIALGIGIDMGFVFAPLKTNDNIQTGIDFSVGYFGMVKDSLFKTNNNLYTINLITRIKGPSQGIIMPYMDVLVGSKVFIVATHYNNNLFNFLNKNADYSTLKSKTSSLFSYGLGIGFKIIPKNKNPDGMFDFRCLFLKSGPMMYDTPYYTEKWVSQTNLVMPQISYTQVISRKKN
jgi:hypothetical protein